MNNNHIKKITEELAINELRLCGLTAKLTQQDIEDISILNQYNSIQDIESIILDICKNHHIDRAIIEIELEEESSVQKELIKCLKNKYTNTEHLQTVCNCSNNKRFETILKNNYII